MSNEIDTGQVRQEPESAFWLCIMLLVALIGAKPLPAQYRSDVWTADAGLPQNVIRGIDQTDDGYLWLATFDGIARFDGVSFTVYNKSNSPGIRSNRFSSMYRDADGDLWLATELSGVTRFHQGQFISYGPAEGVANNVVRGITGNREGKIRLLGTIGVMEFDVSRGRFLPIANKDPDLRYRSLEWGENGGFWAVRGSRLDCFLAGRAVTFHLPSRFQSEAFWGAAQEQNGAILLETMSGQHLRVQPDGSVSGPLGRSVASAYTDKRGHRWRIRVDSRLTRSIRDPLSGAPGYTEFRTLFEDKEQNLWLGSQGQGLFRFQAQSIQTFTKEQGLNDRDVYPIFQDHRGGVWVGAWHTGLSRYANSHFTRYSLSETRERQLTTAIAEDQKGVLWVAAHDGLRVFKDGRFHLVTQPVLPEGALVQAMYEDLGGTLWLGTSRGLVSFRNGRTAVLTVGDGLATDDVRVITEAPDRALWIGGYGGLTRIRQDGVKCWREQDGLPSNNVRAVHVDERNVVWVGTYDGGLGKLEKDNFTRITARDGLFNNGVFQILDDRRGNFWMSSNRGIYRVSKDDLRRFVQGKGQIIRSISYGKADGMLNVECNGGLSPAGIRTREGTLWFPTQDGVAVVDPTAVKTNPTPPPVMVESATVDHNPASLDRIITVPPRANNLEIRYTALSFIKSDQILFRYRMEGLDSDWSDVGTRRVAFYSHLPPGSYVFHVIAANSDGIWNEQGRRVMIHVLAPFYVTLWFRSVAVLLFLLLLTLLWRYRMAQLQRAQLAQQAFARQLISSQELERKRIAAELHDSLGQRLIVIKNLVALLARSRQNENAAQTQAFEEITDETVQAITETREISYNLRPFQLDRLGLTKALDAMARKVCAASGITCEREIENVDDLAPEELRINLYRIIQEALNNIVKHSQAKWARVNVKRNPAAVIIMVEDNGVGFDSCAAHISPANGGFGLTGMSERATLLGGEFKVRSSAGHGTVITIELPLGRE